MNSQIPALIRTNEEALEALKCKSNEEFKEPLSLSLSLLILFNEEVYQTITKKW